MNQCYYCALALNLAYHPNNMRLLLISSRLFDNTVPMITAGEGAAADQRDIYVPFVSQIIGNLQPQPSGSSCDYITAFILQLL
ncbi:hypothetical protein D3C81_1915720 [compost metagenome]